MTANESRTREALPGRRGHLLEEMLSRRDLGRYSAAAGLAALLPGIAAAQSGGNSTPAAPAPERPRGGTLTVAQAGDPDSLDPQHAITGISGTPLRALHDTLIDADANLNYEGILAESWEISEDGLEYTFHLRQGITFHDGTEFNADAVKFTFDRIVDPETNSLDASSFTVLKETVVVDPLTVKFVITEQYAPMLTNISTIYIPSPTAVQTLGSDFDRNPVGTGPWKFKEWITGESITLVPFESYRNFHSYMENKGAPYFDELVIKNIPESATQIAAFETGEVQVLMTLALSEVENFRSNPDYEVIVPSGSNWFYYIEFAMATPAGEPGAVWKAPFDDLRVRQAVGYGLDVDAIIDGVLYGLYPRVYGMIPTGMFGYRPDIEQYGFHFDPDKAKALLDEAGWIDPGDGIREKDGQKLELLMRTWIVSPNDKIVQVIQNQLGAIGMKVNLDIMEVAVFLATLKDGPQNFDVSAWGGYDPVMLQNWVGSDQPISGYRPKEYTDLLDQANRTIDSQERIDLFFEAQKMLLADAMMIPLFSGLQPTGVRTDVKNVKFTPRGAVSFEDAYLPD
jgi:peptide/nickel transport system substrate-binding protein